MGNTTTSFLLFSNLGVAAWEDFELPSHAHAAHSHEHGNCPELLKKPVVVKHIGHLVQCTHTGTLTADITFHDMVWAVTKEIGGQHQMFCQVCSFIAFNCCHAFFGDFVRNELFTLQVNTEFDDRRCQFCNPMLENSPKSLKGTDASFGLIACHFDIGVFISSGELSCGHVIAFEMTFEQKFHCFDGCTKFNIDVTIALSQKAGWVGNDILVCDLDWSSSDVLGCSQATLHWTASFALRKGIFNNCSWWVERSWT